MNRGEALESVAAALALGWLGEERPRAHPGLPHPVAGPGGARDRRPRPQRYFGGRAGRKLTRRLRMQEGRNP